MPERKLVLLVEDNETLARFFRLALEEKAGCDVVLARDAVEAFDLARRHRPDAIHMDIQLLGSNGWDAIRALKADADLRHVPICVVSSGSKRSAPPTDLALVAAVMEKPVGLADYVEKMLNVLGLQEPLESLSSARRRQAAEMGQEEGPSETPQRWRA
jgi:two-component system cell cycle response regulator DivK